MKIEVPNSLQANKYSMRVRKRDVNNLFSLENSTDITNTASLQNTLSLSSLFLLQEDSSFSKVFLKAENLLDLLEDLKLNILSGNLSQKDFFDIENIAKNLHEETSDEQLKEILLEIETRALVEIAKRAKNNALL